MGIDPEDTEEMYYGMGEAENKGEKMGTDPEANEEKDESEEDVTEKTTERTDADLKYCDADPEIKRFVETGKEKKESRKVDRPQKQVSQKSGDTH